VHEAHRIGRTYCGSPRVHRALKKKQVRVSRRRIIRCPKPRWQVGLSAEGRNEMRTSPCLRLGSLMAAAVLSTACGGYDCVDQTCADLTGDPSLAARKVSICHHPQGDCQGCLGWKVLDSDGNKLADCQDSEPGNCEPFMTQDADDYCTLGAVVGCGKGGSTCETSGDCCAGLVCTVNTCG
jgi:hypothetical protein